MILKKKDSLDVEKFWSDYEASIGEKVLAKSLGEYLSGLPQYSQPMWGLAIATSGGFRFHHFPHEGWLIAVSRTATGGEAPKEKTFFIPKDSIHSVQLVQENRWWKKIITASHPALVVHCSVNGKDTKVIIETDRTAGDIVRELGAVTEKTLQADNFGAG